MILDFVLRAGVVVAVIVATKRLDIWDSSDESIKNVHRIKGSRQALCSESLSISEHLCTSIATREREIIFGYLLLQSNSDDDIQFPEHVSHIRKYGP